MKVRLRTDIAGRFVNCAPRNRSCDARIEPLQNQQMAGRSFLDGGECNAGIESDEPSCVMNRKSEQIDVGQLPRSVDSCRIDDLRIQQADFIRPEFMDIFPARGGELSNDSSDG
jgi:hypothetical protein